MQLKIYKAGFLIKERPFYPLDLQQRCLDIRKTGIGLNSQPTIFYASRKRECKIQTDPSGHKNEDLADALRRLGLNVTLNKVKNAVKTLYPEGLTQQHDEGRVVRDLFRYFEQGA